MPTALWTPDRDVPLDTRDVQTVSREEMKILEDLDRISHRLKLCLICPRCDKAFQGRNASNGQTQSIFCGCREIRATVRTIVSP